MKVNYSIDQVKAICLGYRDLKIEFQGHLYWVPSPMNNDALPLSATIVERDDDLGYIFCKL